MCNTPALYQQGTYAPDTNWRWMGSVAMDQAGDIAMGYSVSSSAIFPQIHYTGRLATDALGLMTQGENSIINGSGSQIGSLSRWGDYTSMSVDPVDDCTFWYTNEYLKTTGSFNWSTRVGLYRLPSCAPAPADYGVSATPSSQTVTQGASTPYTVTVTPSGGFTGAVAFSVTGLPTGASASFSPTSVPGSGSSTMTVTTSTTTAVGNYPLTITGTSGSLTRTTTVTLVVAAAATGDFALSASPTSQAVPAGGASACTVSISPMAVFTGSVTLSASGLPAGTTATFTPNPATGTSATLNLATSTGTPVGSFAITITGTSGTLVHTTSVSLTVTAAPCDIDCNN